MRTAVALIDGEHYPDVVADALADLSARFAFRGAVFLGGTEKIRSQDLAAEAEAIYGLPVLFGSDPASLLGAAIARWNPEVLVDVSDEPVVGFPERFRLVSHALALNVAYEGSDFRFSPPQLEPLSTSPSLSVIGTGKRVGKTAVSGYVARLLDREFGRVAGPGGLVVVAMGRGGPREPEVLERRGEALVPADLLEWSRAGRHAASDHFEDAALSRVTTVGCRRCGGGMAGQVFVSNVAAGAARANRLRPGFTIFEGSGAAIPPVATDARILVAGANQPVEQVSGYLGAYRVLISDAVVLTMAEEPLADRGKVERMMAAVRGVHPMIGVVPVVFRPRPAEDVAGRKVAVFTTAAEANVPALTAYLEERYGCRVTFFSRSLSRRPALREELSRPEVREAEVFLTEIKAAAIDVVVEEAVQRDVQPVFLDNEPVEVGPAGEGDLAALCLQAARLARERFREARAAG